jgi:hypothetical protein
MDKPTEEPSQKTFLLSLFTSRYRYVFGLVIFVFLLFGSLFIAWHIPGQLSEVERQSAIKSATISFTDPAVKTVVDLPYSLLQKMSLHFFGLTHFAIKLPSLILGVCIGLGILWLLRCWLLRSSIALFSGVIAITSSQFLLAASSGTPFIMPLFWIVALLLMALKLSANHTSLPWSLCAGLVLGLSLYTPLSLYLIVSLPFAMVLHPHLRYLLRTMPRKNILLSFLLFSVILIPLAIALVKQPSLSATLVGWPGSEQSLGQIKLNLIELAKSYLVFWYPKLTPMGLVPLFGIGSLCLIALGGFKLAVDHHSARSYSLAVLVPVLSVPVLLQPQYAIVLFIPFILLLAIGIEALLDEWYKLFPHNPYARVVALVPVMILLLGLVVSNISRYTNVLRYSPTLPQYYSQDLNLVRPVVQAYPTATLVVSENEKPFYDLLRRDFPKLRVAQKPDASPNHHTIIASQASALAQNAPAIPALIITDSYRFHDPRFYVYTAR